MQTKKHLVMAPFPAQGHLNPMVRLAWSILNHSSEFHITIVYSSEHTPQGQDAAQAQQSSSLHLVSVPEGRIPEHELKGSSSGFIAMMKAAQEMQQPLERVVTHLQTDGEVVCIISDSLLGWNQEMADRLGIPLASLWTASATACIMYFQVNELINKDLVPVGEKLRKYGNIRLDGIPGLEDFHLADLPYGFYDMSSVQAMALPFSRMKDAACILVSAIESLEAKFMLIMRTLHPKTLAVALETSKFDEFPGHGERDECLRWLDEKDPSSVIYISFGTLANLSAAQIEEIAAGLEMAGVTFLWAFRTDFAIDGGAAIFEEFNFMHRTRAHGRGMVVPWVPQVRVLNHPTTGLFLSHCGWNSTLEGVRAGVPFLTWPCSAEQNVNAKNIIQEWKIGLPLREHYDGPEPDKIVTRERIKQVISSAMEDEELRENGKRLRRLLETTGSPIQSGLCSFLQDLRQRSL